MKRRSTTATETAATAQAAGATPVVSDRGTLRRGLQLAPEMTRGLGWTLLLALVATTSNVIVPMTIQRAIDDGILAPGGIDLGVVRWTCALAVVGVVVAGLCSYVMNVRLFKASEAGLATLRVKAFAHVHALSTLTLNASRRGSMVSRVTSDVDQISMFVQRGGMMLIVSIGQLLVATALMLWYSPLLTAVVWATFVPLVFLLRHFQRVVGRAYGVVRERVADMLSAISESVAGAATVRLFGVQERTQARMDETIERQRRAAISAQIRAVGAFVSGQGISGLALVLVGALAAAAGGSFVSAVSARFDSLTSPTRSASDERPAIWAYAGELVDGRPFTGVGVGGLPETAGDATFGMMNVAPLHAHSIVLTALAEGGLLALATLSVLLVVGVRVLARMNARGAPVVEVAAAAALAGAFVHGVIDFPWRAPALTATTWLLVGLLPVGVTR